MQTLLRLALTVLLLALSLSCGSSSKDEAAKSCDAGFERRGSECVPCPAWTLPAEGGGCGCFDGFAYQSDKRSCEPVLPPSECAPGTMPMLGRTTCEPVGVTDCGAGFTPDGRGGCDAILPKTACAKGTMAVPGDTECREVAACGADAWGDIADEPGVMYVRKDYTGGSSDGSRAKPFTTIQAAIAAARANALVAIADGIYPENIFVSKPLRLRGRCPAKVEIQGTTGAPTLLVSATGDVLLRGFSVSGTGDGVGLVRGNIELNQVTLHDLGGFGVRAVRDAVVVLRGSLIEAAHENGVAILGASATIEGSVFRGTTASPTDPDLGRGLYVQVDPGAKRAADVTVRASVIEKNEGVGVEVLSSKLVLERSVVRDTGSRAADQLLGTGVLAHVDPGTKLAAELTLRQSLVERNRYLGVKAGGAKALIEATTIRDTLPQPDKKGGRGISGELDGPTKRPADIIVRGSLIERNLEGGIVLNGSIASVEASIVRDTQPQAIDNEGGAGIHAQADPVTKVPSQLTIRASLVERNCSSGIGVVGSKASIESTLIRDTTPRASDKQVGRGITAMAQPISSTNLPADLSVLGSIIERNHESGIAVSGSTAVVEASVVRDSLAAEDNRQFGVGIGVYVDIATRLASSLVLRGSLLERNLEHGIAVMGSAVTLERAVIRDTKPSSVDALFGDGLGVIGRPYSELRLPWINPSTLTARASLIRSNARAGVVGFGDSDLSFEDVSITCNALDLAIVPGVDGATTYEPRLLSTGTNTCGCDAESGCKAESKDVSEIPPPPPPRL